MRFKEYPSKQDWHKWFAWHPVSVGNEAVWLEVIERKVSYSIYDDWWEYRERPSYECTSL